MFTLYIPIWFYSNKKAAARYASISSFTFQSGSIQMPREIFFELIGNNFTFQSGSIQISTAPYTLRVAVSFTFQSGSIQIFTKKNIFVKR